MGKTTLYHPISLHVIRGAAEFCGWRFGTVKQLRSDETKQTATYIAQIEDSPFILSQVSPEAATKALNSAFMDDIRVSHLRKTGKGNWKVYVDVDLNKAVAEYDLD